MSDEADIGTIIHPDDLALGARIRQLRLLAKMSQDELGGKVGVSFQQILKYESGMSRVAYSRLAEIARALKMTVAKVVEPLDGNHPDDYIEALDLFGNPQVIELARLFGAMQDMHARKALIEVARYMGE